MQIVNFSTKGVLNDKKTKPIFLRYIMHRSCEAESWINVAKESGKKEKVVVQYPSKNLLKNIKYFTL